MSEPKEQMTEGEMLLLAFDLLKRAYEYEGGHPEWAEDYETWLYHFEEDHAHVKH